MNYRHGYARMRNLSIAKEKPEKASTGFEPRTPARPMKSESLNSFVMLSFRNLLSCMHNATIIHNVINC